MGEQRGNDFVQSLARGLAVIRAFDGENPRLTLSDVSRRTGLTRAAARRFLLTLVELGYVHHDGREFSLRPSVLDLGYAYLSSMGLPEVAMPHMETLVATVEESSSMSVLDGGSIVYVARVPTRRRIMTVAIAVGTRFPAYATSMGRVLLAGLGPEALDDALAELELQPFTETTVHDVGELRPRPRRRPRAAATRSSTRSSSTGCAQPPRPCAMRPGRWSPPSTCRSTRRGRRSRTSSHGSSRRCSPPSSGSAPTTPPPDPAASRWRRPEQPGAMSRGRLERSLFRNGRSRR